MRVTFDIDETGLATVGYVILNADGSEHTARTTTGVTEAPAGSMSYGAEVDDDILAGRVVGWNKAVGEPVYCDAYPPGLAKVPAESSELTTLITHGDAYWGAADVPSGWIAITEETLDTTGVAFGHGSAGATVTAYASTDTARATPIAQCTVETDGDWTLYVPPGDATYTLVMQNIRYRETVGEAAIS